MTTATLGFYIGMVGALLLGFVLAAAVGFPIVRAHALAESAETIRVLTNPVLRQPERTDWPRPVTPRTSDTVTDLPVQFGTLAEHKRRERVGWIEVTDAGPVETTHPDEVGWPLWWRLAWPVLLFAAMAPVDLWHTGVGERVDRAAVRLARHERRWCYEMPAARHAAAVLDGEAERRRRALLEPTQELPLLFSLADVGEIPMAHTGELAEARS